jgi:glycosyltransferase involved in cell wall biosynthesis
MKYKVLFFVEFDSPASISWDELEIGNPGIGGTQYTTLCLVKELSKIDDYDIKIACKSLLKLDAPIEVLQLTIEQAVDFAEFNSCILVYRPTINFDPALLRKLTDTSASVVAWAHVGPSQKTLRLLSSMPSIKRVVALGERELISWFDNPVINKSVLIRNGHHIPSAKSSYITDVNAITYIGSLVPQKGFHLLAEVWPKIIQMQPQMYLNVVGSGNLYSSQAGLGRLGIADPAYEELILRNLGHSINSVNFLGKLGGESKNEVVASSYVGIINPSGNTENCPLSALDFQSLSVPVLSARKYGVIDTVKDGETGILFRHYTDLPQHLDKLIRNPSLRESLAGRCLPFIQERFNFANVVNEWNTLFSNLDRPISAREINFSDSVNTNEVLTIANGKFIKSLGFNFRWLTIIELNTQLRAIIRFFLSYLKRAK